MSKKVRILSIDGGGMRGIIPATVLKYVEDELKIKAGYNNARLADFFDLVVGTSTGGILTCFYLMPAANGEPYSSKYAASKALEFYVDKGGIIFNQAKNSAWFGMRQLFNATRFKADNIEKIFREEFGDAEMSDLLKPCIVTTYDMESQNSVFFHSKEKKKERRFRIEDVVRSTSAAPTYFPPATILNLSNGEKMINLDGGVFANNPAMCAYVEARKSKFNAKDYPAAKDMLFLSLGTGGGNIDLPNVNRSSKWGVISWAKSVPNIMMDGGAETIHYQMDAIFSTLNQKEKANYLRINVPVDKRNYSSDMSNASKENIDLLVQAGRDTLSEAKKFGLDEFIDKLVNAEE